MILHYMGLDEFLTAALVEDLGTGDITTLSCVPPDQRSTGQFVAKEAGMICGVDIVSRVFSLIDPTVSVVPLLKDGTPVQKGDVIAEISGCSRSILSGERVALNLLQHLSGISTKTARAVSDVAGTKAKIIDTRKTTPGLRRLEKYAIRIGGGYNHRFNLADGVLIKDNHIIAAGGIENAVKSARMVAPHTLRIEVEASNRTQIDEALAVNADIIMLDNMSIEEMAQAVRHIDGKALVEASGNMGDKDLREVAKTGVDYISIGALTHSVRALDISLQFQ